MKNGMYIAEIVQLLGWLSVIVFVFVKRKGVPVNTFWAMILAAVCFMYAGIDDLIFPFQLVQKSFVRIPANILTMVVFVIGAKRYNREYKEKKVVYRKVNNFIENTKVSQS